MRKFRGIKRAKMASVISCALYSETDTFQKKPSADDVEGNKSYCPHRLSGKGALPQILRAMDFVSGACMKSRILRKL